MSYDPKRPRCDVRDCNCRAKSKVWLEVLGDDLQLNLCVRHIKDDQLEERIADQWVAESRQYRSEAGDRAWKEKVEG